MNLTRDPTRLDPTRSADGPDPCPSLVQRSKIDTDLLLIVTSNTDELNGGT